MNAPSTTPEEREQLRVRWTAQFEDRPHDAGAGLRLLAEHERAQAVLAAVEQFAAAASVRNDAECERAIAKATDALYRAWRAYAGGSR